MSDGERLFYVCSAHVRIKVQHRKQRRVFDALARLSRVKVFAASPCYTQRISGKKQRHKDGRRAPSERFCF